MKSAIPKIRLTFPWMFGPWLDFGIFFASVTLTFLVLLLTRSTVVAASSVFLAAAFCSSHGVGEFHGGATWFAYCDRRNVQYYCSTFPRLLRFMIGPWLVIFGSMLIAYISTDLLYGIYILWTIQHLCQQNVGILLLYHNPNSGEAIVDRKVELNSIYAPAWLFTLIMCTRFDLFYMRDLLVVRLLIFACAIWTVFAVLVYLFNLVKRVLEGNALNVPAFVFWLISVSFFFPAVVTGTDPFKSLLVPLMMHWVQYIGLNYMLAVQKYSTAEQRQNLVIKRPVLLLTTVCVSTVAFVVSMSVFQGLAMAAPEWQQKLGYGYVIGISNLHYYVDAFIWRFREPYQRDAILSHLLAWRKRPVLVEASASAGIQA